MNNNLEKFNFNVKKYTPGILTGTNSADMLIASNDILRRKFMSWSDAYSEVRKEYSKYRNKAIRLACSNNWLKMHGYPMRRGKENQKWQVLEDRNGHSKM